MPKRKRPVLGVDYVIDPDGKAEFTPEYLLKRGYCCEHACRYCPFLCDGSVNIEATGTVAREGVSGLAVLTAGADR